MAQRIEGICLIQPTSDFLKYLNILEFWQRFNSTGRIILVKPILFFKLVNQLIVKSNQGLEENPQQISFVYQSWVFKINIQYGIEYLTN